MVANPAFPYDNQQQNQLMNHHQFLNLEGLNFGSDQQQQDNITLSLEELEKIFDLFHPKPQNFEDCEIRDSHRLTCIPHMTMNSMFFACYSDEIYDTILEDLRENYINLCNEWLFFLINLPQPITYIA